MLDTHAMRRPFNVREMSEDIEQELNNLAEAPTRAPLLIERAQTHGSFEDNAIVSQGLKNMFRSVPGWNRLTDVEKEVMDMVAVKFSRVLSGRSLEKQHWEDVVGYAKLAEEKCI